jgi:hypothetical protein
MPPKGSSNRAVSQQATAAAILNSPNRKRKEPMTRVTSPKKPPRKKSDAQPTTDARPAVTVERAEEEGDERAEEEGDERVEEEGAQTPYLNPFQR